MKETFALAVIALLNGILGNVYIIAGAILVIAVIFLVVALWLFRGSGKKKRANAAGAAGSSDWQRQGQQGAPGGMNAWNQQGPGISPDSAWGQAGIQQPNSWVSPQQGGWDAQSGQPQGMPLQQQAGAWGMQNPSQQPGGWDAQNPSQQQAGAWGMQNPAAQQAGAWGAQSGQPGGWDGQSPSQQQVGNWGMQSPSQQSAGWGAQSSAQQQPGSWGNQAAPLPGTGGLGGQQQQSWDATSVPASNDPWAQQGAGAPSWGAQAPSAQSNQQAPTSYSSSGSGQSWGQAPQASDPWAQPAAQQQGAWSPPSGLQQPSPSSPSAGNAGQPSWQQQGQGFGQQGVPAQQVHSAPTFDNPDSDRTVLRSTGSGPQGQGRLGIVRIEEGKEPGRVYEVRKESLSIGRSRESDIFLEDLAVSRLHASIVSLGNGNYALRDEGSANGTKVNGQAVNKYQPYPLQEGDKIQLGQTVLVFARR